MSKEDEVVLEEEVIEELPEEEENIEELPGEEVVEISPEEELATLKQWLLEVTNVQDVNLAKTAVERALVIEKIIPQIGVLSVMVGPGGVLQTLISQNLTDDDGMDNVEAALLDIQRNIVQARRQKKLAKEKTEPEQ